MLFFYVHFERKTKFQLQFSANKVLSFPVQVFGLQVNNGLYKSWISWILCL